jgi:hypothetical protein
VQKKKRGRFVAKFVPLFVGSLAFALAGAAGAAIGANDFPLAGNYTQNVACKGDGSDPPDIRVKISAKEIISKVGVCTFLDSKQDGNIVKAHVECKFQAGPLVGEITFTIKPDKNVQFVDRDQNYRAVLYRCPD